MNSGTKRHTSATVPSPTRADFADTIASGRRLGVPKTRGVTDADWEAHLARETARHQDGEARLGDAQDADSRQRQLTRLGNCARGGGRGLSVLRRPVESSNWATL